MNERIRNNVLRARVTSAREAVGLIKKGMVIGASGFTPSGYPKAVPLALAEIEKENGNDLDITLLTGASVGNELDGVWAEAGYIKRRYPYQSNPILRDKINSGEIEYADIHLSHFPQQVRMGYFGRIDLAIIEAVAITEEGHIIPSTSVGAAPVFVDQAEEIIVEINTKKPLQLEGFHDIYQPLNPPNRKPIPLINPEDRIGTPYIKADPEKIKAIVITELGDQLKPFAPVDRISQQMASYLIDFLLKEVADKRLPAELLPLQAGVGSVTNAVLTGLNSCDFTGLSFYSEVIQDSVLELLLNGKFKNASGSSLTTSPEGFAGFKDNISFYKDKVILRPQEISNNPEIIRRLGSIAINTAVEVDLLGNVNSSHLLGNRVLNGIGGAGDFARNAYLSIFLTPSTAKSGKISTIVPLVSHVDHTEHDIQVVITEQGVADLRGLVPAARARTLIENCAHPDYRGDLRDYYKRALKRGGHLPIILEEAFSWHKGLFNSDL